MSTGTKTLIDSVMCPRPQLQLLLQFCCLLTVTDGVFPLVLCLYYVCISLIFRISVSNCGLSIFNKRILLLLLVAVTCQNDKCAVCITEVLVFHLE